MMTIKHLIAGAAVTAAVSTALVLGSAVGANAQVFPTPTPISPASTNYPIYTQPSYPGFHLPPSIWQKSWSKFPLKPAIPKEFIAFHVLPSTCAQLFPTGSPQAGATLSADTSVQATTDRNLVGLLNAQPSLNCNWTNPATGLQLEVSVALINQSLIAPLENYFNAQGYIGEGVGDGLISSVTATNPVERDDVSTNDYWVVVRANDMHLGDYDFSILQTLWSLNGLSYE